MNEKADLIWQKVKKLAILTPPTIMVLNVALHADMPSCINLAYTTTHSLLVGIL